MLTSGVLRRGKAICIIIRTIILFPFLLVAFITPLTYIAYQGQPDVMFQCSATNVHSISWCVDDDLRSEAGGIEINRTHIESYLTISSIIENNNTRIRCFAFSYFGGLLSCRNLSHTTSDEATFYVQGEMANLSGMIVVVHNF